MLKIGLTGNIGSGKTTVCKVFELLGTPVFYADIHAKECLNEYTVKEKIFSEFGADVFDDKGNVIRKALADIVFQQKNKLSALNNIIHPLVSQKFKSWMEKFYDHPYCIQEAAILFETGGYRSFDFTILVYAPTELLINRTVKRDRQTTTEVEARLANQMDQEKKRELADFVIENDNKELIIPEIIEIHNYFLSLYKKQR
jgi:dephospho-CoA kinase